MEEKRRHKRISANLQLNVSSLFKQDNIRISNINAPITVVNVSKSGIGFKSACVLPVDYYFNAALCLGSDDELLYFVVKIIRCQPIEDSNEYSYGCEFVGMPDMLMYIFDEFEERQSHIS